VKGLDGQYASEAFCLEASKFEAINLEEPIRQDRRYDMAICLEVAEHLEPWRAEGLVADLCSFSNLILFSAAIPRQGGTDHKNENWPEYWARHFKRNGFVPIDIVREKFWNNDDVDWWYSQNILFYVQDGHRTTIFPADQQANENQLTRVHHKMIRA
jgi:hypothetical protein